MYMEFINKYNKRTSELAPTAAALNDGEVHQTASIDRSASRPNSDQARPRQNMLR